MAAINSPIKVDAETRERIRLAAAFLNITQGEFVRRLVLEYVGTSKPLRERVEEARTALLGGDEAMVEYMRGEFTSADFKAAGGGVA